MQAAKEAYGMNQNYRKMKNYDWDNTGSYFDFQSIMMYGSVRGQIPENSVLINISIYYRSQDKLNLLEER